MSEPQQPQPDPPAGWVDPDARPAQQQPQWIPPPGVPVYPGVPYGPPGAAPPGYGFPPPRRSNGLAITSMAISISAAVLLVCAVCLSFIVLVSLAGGVVGAILGHVARRQIRERGEQGDGMALAGIITGWITAGLSLAAAVLFAVLIGSSFGLFGPGSF